ncbi:MAG: S-layer homology domain-containing protein [Clostridia bacterium]|nr:S-layer homology domain-containing protein [Clostridia bacterium]
MKNRNILKKLLLPALFAVLLFAQAVPAAAYGQNPFTDVSPSAWYYSDVMTAVESGLINGKTKTTFCPDDYLTYAEAVKLAACMNQVWWTGSVALSNGIPWYQPYVDYAWTTGILSENYDWNGYATRGKFLAIFANALPGDALDAINSVPEDSIPDVPAWYPDAWTIYSLYQAGIVQGDDTHACRPEQYIRRSEVAAILNRMMNPSARLRFSMSADTGITAAPAEPETRKYWIVVDFYDRDDLTVYTEATTLGMILYNNGITLAEGEVPSVDLWNDWLAADMTVTVDTYFYTTESVRQIVPHTTEEIGIDTIPRGDVNILEEGADGESILHYTVTYKNGMEYDRRLDWEEVLTAMVPARAEVGVGGTFVGGDGVTYSYSWKKICKATYYNLVGPTYSGNYTSTRTVATNLDYIPIGTRMYIKNDRYDFGYRVSEDTGHLDPWQVDIWMMDDDPNAPLMSIEGVVRDMEVYFLD